LEEIINNIIKLLLFEHTIVTIPVFGVFIMILFKAHSFGGDLSFDSVKPMLNIGLDLAAVGIFVLLINSDILNYSNVNDQSKDLMFEHGAKILFYLGILSVFSLAIRVWAWEKKTNSLKNTWLVVIVINIVGTLLFSLSIILAKSKGAA